MTVVIKNKKSHLINLGTKQGKMLIFNPDEEKEMAESLVAHFEDEILKYVEGDFLEIVTKKKAAVAVDSVVNESPVETIVAKPKAKGNKKRTSKA